MRSARSQPPSDESGAFPCHAAPRGVSRPHRQAAVHGGGTRARARERRRLRAGAAGCVFLTRIAREGMGVPDDLRRPRLPVPPSGARAAVRRVLSMRQRLRGSDGAAARPPRADPRLVARALGRPRPSLASRNPTECMDERLARQDLLSSGDRRALHLGRKVAITEPRRHRRGCCQPTDSRPRQAALMQGSRPYCVGVGPDRAPPGLGARSIARLPARNGAI